MTIFDTITALADAIRAKTGRTAPLTLEQMTAAVSDLAIGTELPRAESIVLSNPEGGAYLETNGKGLQFTAFLPAGSGAMILDENTKIVMKVPSGIIGDARASDVRAGKTFTSASGLHLTGTLEV